MPSGGSPVKEDFAVSPLGGYFGSFGHQNMDHIPLALIDSIVEGSISAHIPAVRISPCGDQYFSHFGMPLISGPVQRHIAGIVFKVDLPPFF